MSPQAPPASRIPISGVFSTVEPSGLPGQRRKTFWSVRELDDGRIEVSELSPNPPGSIGTGRPRIVDLTTFLELFEPEPEYAAPTPAPNRGVDQRRGSGAPAPAPELSSSLRFEETVRDSFRLALALLQHGQEDKAGRLLDRILDQDAEFRSEHKHVLNDCGISLRKNRRFDKALKFYRKASRLAQDDEHLLHNIARAYYEKGDMENALRNLRRSLELNPDLAESQRFLRFITRRMRERQRATSGPPVSES